MANFVVEELFERSYEALALGDSTIGIGSRQVGSVDQPGVDTPGAIRCACVVIAVKFCLGLNSGIGLGDLAHESCFCGAEEIIYDQVAVGMEMPNLRRAQGSIFFHAFRPPAMMDIINEIRQQSSRPRGPETRPYLGRKCCPL